MPALCALCGEPMPENEQIFKYHGFSGPCPKPPRERHPKTEVIAEYSFLDDLEGALWIDVKVNRQPWDRIGPFDTATERQRAFDDLMSMTRSAGAKDLSFHPQ